ncbi:S-layer homology domain-containing protein, partial [Candidatus Peregrinibacteria bacterium]|nr:S-layer homology domain-containing protein [Candidatus Peregrinibacteria bacterium]
MKKIIFLFTSFFLFSLIAYAFYDVLESDRYYKAINLVRNEGIVSGYPDGSFKPERKINRAEMLKIIIESKFSESEIEQCLANEMQPDWTYTFLTDVPRHEWFAKYVCIAKINDIIQGYPDGTFKPANNINFVEALKITAKAYGIPFSEEGVWYEDLIKKVNERGNLIPLTINEFGQEITRGEMADMIGRFFKEERGELDEYLGDEGDYTVNYETIRRRTNVEAQYQNRTGSGALLSTDDTDESEATGSNETTAPEEIKLVITQGTVAVKSFFIGDSNITAFALNLKAIGDDIFLNTLKIRFFYDDDGNFTSPTAGDYSGDQNPEYIDSVELLVDSSKMAGPVEPIGNEASFEGMNYEIPAGVTKTIVVKADLRSTMELNKIYIAGNIKPHNDIGVTANTGVTVPFETSADLNFAAFPQTVIQVSKIGVTEKPAYDEMLACGSSQCDANEICKNNQCVKAPMTLVFVNGGFDDDIYFDSLIEEYINKLEEITPLEECPGQIRVHRIYECCADEANIDTCAKKYVPNFDVSIFLHPKDIFQCDAISEENGSSIISSTCDPAFVREWGRIFAGFADQYCLNATFNGQTINPILDNQGCGYSQSKREYTCPVGGACWNRATNESTRLSGGLLCNSNADCVSAYGSDWECVSCYVPIEGSWEWLYCSEYRDPPVFCLGNLTSGNSRSVMGAGWFSEIEFDTNEYSILEE